MGWRIKEYNIALLGIWCWRMLVDNRGLWFRMLKARYGVEGGHVKEGGSYGLAWLREMVRIHEL